MGLEEPTQWTSQGGLDLVIGEGGMNKAEVGSDVELALVEVV